VQFLSDIFEQQKRIIAMTKKSPVLEGHLDMVPDEKGALQWAFSRGKSKHILKEGDILVVFNDAARTDELARTQVHFGTGSPDVQSLFSFDPEPLGGGPYYEGSKIKGVKEVVATILDGVTGDKQLFGWDKPVEKNCFKMFRDKKPAILIPAK
jgi:hypothetical protein